jgi:4-amino-4-deoxy-L-arabinose transferase-like glycosyltransferase
VAVAAGLRFSALNVQPGGLYPDEAAEALDAHYLVHSFPAYHPVFFQSDAGREALYGYLVAAAFRLFGETTTVLRATSAALGLLAVVAVYAWLRKRGPVAALTAAAWVAGSLWLVCISRDGMRNVLVPLVAALALWALTTWADAPSPRAAALAGAAMGLGLWTYQPLKLLPVLFVAWTWLVARGDPGRWPAMRPTLRWVALAYIVAGAPMILTAITDPGHYFGRAVAVTAGSQAAAGGGVLEHTWRTLLMFAFTGDPNQRHDVNGLPLLGLPVAVVAGVGLAMAWRKRAEPMNALLVVAMPVFLVPPLVATADAAPHFLRSLGLAAPLAGLVGLGAQEVIRRGREYAPQAVLGTGLVIALAGLAAGTGQAYFTRPVSARYDAYSFNLVQLAGAARSADLDVALVDGYQGTDLRFLDWREEAAGRLHTADPVLRPGLPPHPAGTTCAVLALSRGDIARSYPALKANPTVVALDPAGRPSVWKAPC